MGTGIRLAPYPSRYQVSEEFAGQDKYWSTNTTYDDLLFAHGQHVRDYADISHLAKGLMYSKMGITQSVSLSPLFEYVTGDGGTEVIDKNFARWRIYGLPERRALGFGNLNEADYPGALGQPLTLWLDVDWFKDSDILSPVKNKRVQVLLQSEAVPFDGGFKYEGILMDPDDAAYLPDEYLRQGDYWIKTGTATAWEKSATAGSIQFGEAFSYIEYEVPLTTSMWNFTVDGEAHRQFGKLQITRCDEENRPIPGGSKITNYLEMRAKAQIDYEKELMLTYGNKTDFLLDKNSGKQITTSPGLFEYMEEGNIIKYSPESDGIQFIVDQLEAFWFDRVDPANREVTFLTGQAGLKIFNEWITNVFGASAVTVSWDFILQKRVAFDPAGGRQGYAFAKPQFVEYRLPTFGVIKIAHWKNLDNTRINGVYYPGSFYPVNSYEFLAFNTGFGESNVKFLSRDDNKISTYIPHLWSPIGATGADNPIWKTPHLLEDSYQWIHRESYGVVLLDPTMALTFKPNIVY